MLSLKSTNVVTAQEQIQKNSETPRFGGAEMIRMCAQLEIVRHFHLEIVRHFWLMTGNS
jgi:hypothetical protein